MLVFLHWKKIFIEFKVSGCKQFIVATFFKKMLKVIQLNCSNKITNKVAKINWLQPITLKKSLNSMNIFFSVWSHLVFFLIE